MFSKKLKKLGRNPKKFILDSKLIKANREVDEKDEEPRIIGSLSFESESIVNFKSLVVRNQSFATMMLIPSTAKNLNRLPIFGEMLVNEDDFIGFREKTLFGLRVEQTNLSLLDIYEKLVHIKDWHSGKLKQFRNVVLYGSLCKYASFFRSSHPDLVIICILGDKDSAYPLSSIDADHLLLHSSLSATVSGVDFNIEYFRNTSQLVNLIKSKILFAGDKPYDYLVPVYGNVDFIEDIDDINGSEVQLVIKLSKKGFSYGGVNNFSDYIDSIKNRVEYVMMRESWSQKYSSVIRRNDHVSLLKLALKDGAKVRVI